MNGEYEGCGCEKVERENLDQGSGPEKGSIWESHCGDGNDDGIEDESGD